MLDQKLTATILRLRGPNQDLAKELVNRLSSHSKRRLLTVIQDLKDEILTESRKRKRGQFW